MSEDPLQLALGGNLFKGLERTVSLFSPQLENPVRLVELDVNLYLYAINNPINAVDPSGYGPAAEYGYWILVSAGIGGAGTFAVTGNVCSSVVNAVGAGAAGAGLVALAPLSFLGVSLANFYRGIASIFLGTGLFFSTVQVENELC